MLKKFQPKPNSSDEGPRYLKIGDAARIYSVSPDFLRRNKSIRKVTIGKRLVRIDAHHLERFFKEREN